MQLPPHERYAVLTGPFSVSVPLPLPAACLRLSLSTNRLLVTEEWAKLISKLRWLGIGLKFSGVVVTIIGRECVPINPKISVWPYVSKPSISRREFVNGLILTIWSRPGDHGPRLTVVAFLVR